MIIWTHIHNFHRFKSSRGPLGPVVLGPFLWCNISIIFYVKPGYSWGPQVFFDVDPRTSCPFRSKDLTYMDLRGRPFDSEKGAWQFL